MTGIAVVASFPLGSIAAINRIVSAATTAVSKKLQAEASKHKKLITLALKKRDSVNNIVSKGHV